MDSIGNLDVLPEDAGLIGGLRYAGLRLPALYDRIFMFALFLSLLFMLFSLLRYQELVALVVAGFSPSRQIITLLPNRPYRDGIISLAD